MLDRRNTGQLVCRKGGIQYIQVVCSTGWIQDWRDACKENIGKEGCGKGEYRKGGMHERRIKERRDAGKKNI